MPAQLLAGQPVADAVLADVKRRVEVLARRGVVPGLGTILAGDDPASAGYVRKKHETCAAVGIRSFNQEVPASGGQTSLLAAVDRFNADPAVDGYLIQHPVPRGFDFNAALLRMSPDKDADGLHPVNLGKLVLQEKGPLPCTPAGIQAMLLHYGISIEGREVVIVGRGPTPPSRGVIQDATSAQASSTSARSFLPSHVMPPDTTTAPGLIISGLTKPGTPTAATTTSARRVRAPMSRTAVCTTVTAALPPGCFRVSRSESGRPSVGPRPTTTTSRPSIEIP